MIEVRHLNNNLPISHRITEDLSMNLCFGVYFMSKSLKTSIMMANHLSHKEPHLHIY